jgi:hypothetical protein
MRGFQENMHSDVRNSAPPPLNMNPSSPLGLLLFFLASTAGLKAASILTNGEFTGSLASWNSSGTVLNTGDSAVFSDSGATPLSIFQSGGLPADFVRLELSFDYLEGLSPSVPFGFLPDAFFGTLYLGGSPFGPTLAGGVYDLAIGLFDLDDFGLFNVVPGAVFGPSPKGAGWTRFSFTREMPGGFALPKFATVAFESYNLNGTAADSVVAVDNVLLLAVVPEPGPATLLLLGMAGVLLRRRRPSLQS